MNRPTIILLLAALLASDAQEVYGSKSSWQLDVERCVPWEMEDYIGIHRCILSHLIPDKAPTSAQERETRVDKFNKCVIAFINSDQKLNAQNKKAHDCLKKIK